MSHCPTSGLPSAYSIQQTLSSLSEGEENLQGGGNGDLMELETVPECLDLLSLLSLKIKALLGRGSVWPTVPVY